MGYDIAICVEALKQNGSALQYISFPDKNNDIKLYENYKSLLIYVISSSKYDLDKVAKLFKYFSNELLNDYSPRSWRIRPPLVGYNFIMKVLEYNYLILNYTSSNFVNNYDVMYYAAIHNCNLIKYLNSNNKCSKLLKNNFNFMSFACIQNTELISYASEELRNNKLFFIEILKKNIMILNFMSVDNIIDINIIDIIFSNYNYKQIVNKIKTLLEVPHLIKLFKKKLFIKLNNTIINKKYNFKFIIKNLIYLIKYKHIQKYLLNNKIKIINNWKIICNNNNIYYYIDNLEQILNYQPLSHDSNGNGSGSEAHALHTRNIKFIDITLY